LWGSLYSTSSAELVVVEQSLKENISKGFIHQLLSRIPAPVLIAEKTDGGLRVCIDYRDINSTTIKNRCPLPLIRETLNSLRRARVYTKIAFRVAYNLLRVKEGDKHKLACRTRYGLFEPTFMQPGTTNPPAHFQGYINNTIREALDDFASAYLDDILIYSNSEEEHVEHVK